MFLFMLLRDLIRIMCGVFIYMSQIIKYNKLSLIVVNYRPIIVLVVIIANGNRERGLTIYDYMLIC